MQLTKAQSEIAKDQTRFRVLNCGRRFGKTTLAIWEILGKALAKGDRNIVYIAPTYQQARDIAWRDLMKICEPVIDKVNESRLEITIQTKDGGTSRIAFRGWESIETLRGQRYDFIVIDEVAMMRDFWAHWQEVIRPTLTDSKGECLFISTPKGFNHFYDLYLMANEDKNYKSFHFTSYDNSHIPKEEIDDAKRELSEDSFAQEYMADFRKQEGLVYKEFSRDKHLYEETNAKMTETMLGVDFGFTNPAAVLTIQKDFDNNYYVVEEWYRTGKTDTQIAQHCDMIECNKVYADPENPGGIKELSDRGMNVIEVKKGKGSVEAGINKVRQLLRENKLKIHKDCVNLISELETYRYEEKRPNKNEPEKPVKENDHACFPAGTIVNGQKIEDIGVQTGVEQVYTYEIAGEDITATPNHPILTDRGYAHIDTLWYTDVVWKQNKLLFMMVSGSLDTQTLLRGVRGITTSVLKRLQQVKERDCTDMSGGSIMGRFLKAFIYTTLTRIPQTMKLLTLLALTTVNTLRVIGQTKSVSLLKETSRRLLSLLQNGHVPMLVSVEGQRLEKPILTSLQNGDIIPVSATSVIKSIRPKGTGETDGATRTVSKKLYAGVVPVYNLITKSGMFQVNGIVVSNCDALRYALMSDNPVSVERMMQSRRRMQQNRFKNRVNMVE